MSARFDLFYLNDGTIPIWPVAPDSKAWVLNYIGEPGSEWYLGDKSMSRDLVVAEPAQVNSHVLIPLFEIEGERRPGLIKPDQVERDRNLWLEGQIHCLVRKIVNHCKVAPVQVIIRSLDQGADLSDDFDLFYCQLGVLCGGITTRHNFDWPGLDREVNTEGTAVKVFRYIPAPSPIELEF